MCLEQVMPVSDLAKLTLGYIDGSGRPFSSAPVAEEADQGAA